MQSESRRANRVRRRDLLRMAAAATATGVGKMGSWTHANPVRAAAAPGPSLIVGSNFDIKTLDPGRELEEGTNNIALVAYRPSATRWITKGS
jgi:hypothetical protein